MSLRRFAPALWLLGLMACAAADEASMQPAAARAEPLEVSSVGSAKSPLKARLLAAGELVVGEPLSLELQLERRAGAALGPIRVILELPDGVELTRGAIRSELAACASRCSEQLSYEVFVSGAAARDLVFEIDAQGARSGLHARLHHALGRPEPRTKRVKASGRSVRVGTHSWGAPIELTPQSTTEAR